MFKINLMSTQLQVLRESFYINARDVVHKRIHVIRKQSHVIHKQIRIIHSKFVTSVQSVYKKKS
jgi:hypothetical protein